MKPSEVAPVDQSGDSKSVTLTNGTSAHAGDDKLASNNNANKILDNVCNGVKMKADTHTLSRQDVEFASNALLNPIIRDESRRSGRSRSSTPIPSSLPRSGTPNPSQAGSLTQNTLSSKAENTETIANATGVSESQKNIGSFPPWSLKNKKTVSQVDNLLEKVVDENSEDRSSSERSLSHGNDDRTSNADSARSSAERSVDSVDSSSSRFSQKSFGPRARKSGVCSTKGATKPSNVGALSNVTIKLPDFDNPIQLDSRTLEKINRLESKHRSGPNKHVPKKAVPSLQPTESSSVQAKQKQKPHGRRRKNRSGTYLLPTEIRKLKNMKRKSDMDSKNKDDTDSVDGTASSTGAENVSESCPSEEDERMDYDDAHVKTSASKACLPGKPDQSYIACDTNYNSTSAKADSSSIPSSSLSSVVSSSSSSLLTSSQIKQEVVSGEKEHVWEIFRTNNMTKTKNTLGSIRAGRPRKSENKGGGKDFKGKTLDSYLEKMHKTNPTEKQNEKDSLIEEISNIAKKRKLSGSDSEKSKENGFKTNSVHPAEDSGKKPRVDEGPKTTLIKVINTPQVQSGNMRSLLPKNIMALANPSKSPGTPHTKMILLQTSTDTFCSNSKNTFAVVSKPVADSNINAGITTSVSLLSGAIVHTPLLLQKGENLPRMASAKKMPVLAKMLPDKSSLKKLEAEHDSEKENSSDSLPSSLSYPVTPPKTPEDQQSEDSYSIPPGPTPPDKDVIPLCCCKINGASFKKLGSNVTYCQALDSIDGKVMGCCNKVTSLQLVRPGVKIPFMAICEVHRKRLRQHQCCPGCGHFCMQGKFYHCRKDGALSVHYFHKQCQVIKGGKYYCPHCGEESYQIEVSMTFEEALGDHVIEEKPGGRNGGSQNKSKMSIHPNTYRTFLKPEKDPGEDQITASHRLTSNKVLHNGGVPIGPDKASLERVLSNLNLDERPKKFKNLPKCLYNPAYEKDLDKVLFMLVEGVNPDEKFEEFDNQTALHAAAMAGSLPIVHLLVQTGASIHCADKELKTPLMYAAENNHPAVVRYLLKLGADVTAKADDGMTVLHYAAKAGHVDVLKVLMEADKIDINVQDDGGWTPIIWASEHKLVKAVKFLTKHGADPHLKDKEENTSLHWASYSGSVDIAELFLNAGCDLEAPNEHGDRPLHIAARQDHYECVVLFLARGADVDAKNNENDTPIQCCLNENSQVALALAVNRTLKGFAINRLARPQKLVHRDVSMGRENIPIPVVNEVDDDTLPTDFQYVTENTETSDLNINRTITSLQSCRCQDDCSSMFCVCGRNSVKCWYDRSCKLLPEFNMSDPPLVFECNKGCRCWSTCNNRVVQMGITSRLQMFKTIGRGWGVKSLLDIPKGSFVTEYIGELISDSEADSREDDSYLFDLDNRDGDTYCIDARRYGNISRFINHLCEPNLIPVKVFVDHQDLRFPRICLFASRDIKAHEELGFDYGEKFWMIKWKQFTCTCGSPKCKYSSDVILKTVEDYKQRHEEEGSAN